MQTTAPSPVAAARTIQHWYRSTHARASANRLLTWLHLLRLLHSSEGEEENKNARALPSNGSSSSPQNVGRAAVTIFVSDAAVVQQLLTAARHYEEAKRNENYTRVLLLEELMASSAVVHRASQEAHRRLQQQHSALRHLSLSTPLAAAALGEHVDFAEHSSPRRDLSALKGPKQAAAAVAALRHVEEYLGVSHFEWWRATLAAPAPAVSRTERKLIRTAETHVDVADSRTNPTDLPLPLSDASANSQDTVEKAVEYLLSEDDNMREHVDVEEEEEELAYRREREAAEKAFFAATKLATLSDCPHTGHDTLKDDIPVTKDHEKVSDVPREKQLKSAEALFTLGQLEKVRLVAQPVLGSGASGQWHHTTSAAKNRGRNTADVVTSALTCAVCELEGVVDGPDENNTSTMLCGVDEDALVRCATCAALVHTYCALSEKGVAFCCSHCRSS